MKDRLTILIGCLNLIVFAAFLMGAAEPGHAPNRIYTDQQGNFHLNGAQFFNDAETDIAGSLESLNSIVLTTSDQTINGIKTFADGLQVSEVSVTATADGTGTGAIAAGSSHVTVTCDDATKQVSLPTASVGERITVFVGANGCELISSVATHEVNGVVVGATNELALGANTHYRCEYVATDKWIVRGFTSAGADQAALVPDAL